MAGLIFTDCTPARPLIATDINVGESDYDPFEPYIHHSDGLGSLNGMQLGDSSALAWQR